MDARRTQIDRHAERRPAERLSLKAYLTARRALSLTTYVIRHEDERIKAVGGDVRTGDATCRRRAQ